MYENNEYNKYVPAPPPVPLTPAPLPTPPQATPPKKKRRRGNGRAFLLVVVCLFLAAASGFAGGFAASIIFNEPILIAEEALPMIYEQNDEPEPIETLCNAEIPEQVDDVPETELEESDIPATTSVSVIGGAQKTTAEVAATVRDSVVEIKTETVRSSIWGAARVAEGAGSGVIISEDGYIITNNHVISGSERITVRLADGREFDAELVGADVRTDTAIIKIEQTGLTPVIVGDSEYLVVGETALAVGNPLGELGGTVTSGIISALDRDIVLDGEIMTLLQTDAAVNPGNSGGGLFNMQGELIGVVVAKSGGINIEGLGFAIPSNTAKAVASDLLAYGYVRGRADAGLELLDINTPQLANRNGVRQMGLYILSSEDEQLQRGDRIIEINNRTITNQLSFNAAMRHRVPGETVSITVMRANTEITVDVTLTEFTPQTGT